MKAVVLHGSPRRGGNSDTLAEHFIRGLKAAGEVQTWDFYTNEMSIRPCQGCEHCQTSVDNSCAIRDDMQQIYSVFGDADVVVFATPMYWGYITAQLKTVVDRMEALAMNPETYFVDKQFVVILTYRHHYQSTVAFFERIMEYFRFKLSVLTFRSIDEASQKDMHITSCPEKLREAYQLGIALGMR
jgi:multimeric flavodoxin WrbA